MQDASEEEMPVRLWLFSGMTLVALIAWAAACTSGSTANSADGGPTEQVAQVSVSRDPASGISTAALDAAVAANNAFAFDLYERLEGDAGTGAASNLLTSPISASLALTMAYAGAVGQTATEMATALHFDADAGTSIFDGQNALDQALAMRGSAALAAVVAQNANAAMDGVDAAAPSPSDYELQVVNSVWGEKTYPWAKPYLTTLAKSYGAGVYLEDFINQIDQTRQAINAWVSAETDDKISDLLVALDPSTRMVLVNAVHLKFPWAYPFDPSANTSAAFTRADGTTVTATFMNQTLSVPYVDDGQAQIAALPLTLPGGDVSVVIALPHEGTSLATYESVLGTNAAGLTQPQSSAQIALSIPKVTFTSATFSLKPALQSMGMKLAFTPSADFTAICANPLFIEDVLQKTTISMQETGVEAAAATAVLFTTLSAMPTSATMVVNRPYLVAIVDRPTGAILFLGHISDPSATGGP
jgi:serpin B